MVISPSLKVTRCLFIPGVSAVAAATDDGIAPADRTKAPSKATITNEYRASRGFIDSILLLKHGLHHRWKRSPALLRHDAAQGRLETGEDGVKRRVVESHVQDL